VNFTKSSETHPMHRMRPHCIVLKSQVLRRLLTVIRSIWKCIDIGEIGVSQEGDKED
jgi:hypothetical protein